MLSIFFPEYFLPEYLFFFAFFYNSHLHFEEQFQLFLLTDDYFIDKMGYPEASQDI